MCGDRPADHSFYSCVSKSGDPLACLDQPGHELVEVGRGQIEVLVPVDSINAVGLGVFPLVGADQQRVDLPPVVGRGPGVADHRRVEVAQLLHLGHGLRDEVLVDHRHDGHVQTHHGAELGGVAPGRVHHVLGDDGVGLAAYFADQLPTVVGELFHIGDQGVPINLAAQLAGPFDHGLGDAGRVGPAVVGGPTPHKHVGHVHERPVVEDLLGLDQVVLHPNQIEHPADVAEPVHLVAVEGQADGAGAVPTTGQPGLGFDAVVELGGHLVALGHVQAADEVGNESRGVPGGARAQLSFLHQHGVGPTLVGQEIEQARAHGPAADDHHLGFVAHRWPLP